MNILLVHEKYPPIVGGGETHVWLLAEGLVGLGHKVTVATRDPRCDAGRYRGTQVEVVYVPGFQEACAGGVYVDYVRGMWELLVSRSWDLVHVFNTIPMIAVGLLRDTVRCPLVLTLFETRIDSKRLFGLWNDFELERDIQRNALSNASPDAVICGSEAYVDWAVDIGADPSIVSLVPFCVSTDMLDFGGRVIKSSADPSGVYLVPARAIRRKRLEDVIVAFGRLLSVVPTSRLVLLGGGVMGDSVYRRELVSLIEAEGLTRCVDWLDGVDASGMLEVYASVDAAVLAASDDGFGIALIESMAMGVPVIASNVAGHDEAVIDGESGILTRLGDIDGLARAMYDVVWDSRLRAKLIGGGRKRVERYFSQSAMVAGSVEVYQTCLSHVSGTSFS